MKLTVIALYGWFIVLGPGLFSADASDARTLTLPIEFKTAYLRHYKDYDHSLGVFQGKLVARAPMVPDQGSVQVEPDSLRLVLNSGESYPLPNWTGNVMQGAPVGDAFQGKFLFWMLHAIGVDLGNRFSPQLVAELLRKGNLTHTLGKKYRARASELIDYFASGNARDEGARVRGSGFFQFSEELFKIFFIPLRQFDVYEAHFQILTENPDLRFSRNKGEVQFWSPLFADAVKLSVETENFWVVSP